MYWSGWQTLTTLMAAMLVGYALVAVSYALELNPSAPKIEWRAALWIAPYFLGMLVISYFGGFGPGGIIGGIGIFKHVLDHGGNNDLGLVGGLVALGGLEPCRSTASRSRSGCREPPSNASSATSAGRARAAA